MVFRKDTKVDAFQRQISALRQQLGTDGGEYEDPEPSRLTRVEPIRAPRETPALPVYETGPDRSSSYGSSLEPDENSAFPDVPDFPMPESAEHASIVAHDTVWNGDLQSNGSLHIHGQAKGTITAKNDVFIAEEARVEAVITAENVSIAGSVEGTIRCTGRFEVLPHGRVSGEIMAPVLVIHEGAVIDGKFSMTRESVGIDGGAVVRRRIARSGS